MSNYGSADGNNSPVGMKANIAIPQQSNMQPLIADSGNSKNEPSSPTGSAFSGAF